MKAKFLLKAIACLSLLLPHVLCAHSSPKMDDEQNNIERVLWGVPTSPYVRVALVTFYEKNLAFTHKKTLPALLLKAKQESIDVDFTKCSPLGKIPAYAEIRDGETYFCLSESSVISDYLNEIEKSSPLRPTCPKANARVSYFVSYVGTTLAPATHALRFENVVKPKILKEVANSSKIEKILGQELPS